MISENYAGFATGRQSQQLSRRQAFGEAPVRG
jgi:hypothetical protein